MGPFFQARDLFGHNWTLRRVMSYLLLLISTRVSATTFRDNMSAIQDPLLLLFANRSPLPVSDPWAPALAPELSQEA